MVKQLLLLSFFLFFFSCAKDPTSKGNKEKETSFKWNKEKKAFTLKSSGSQYEIKLYKKKNTLYLLDNSSPKDVIERIELSINPKKQKETPKVLKIATCGCPGERETLKLNYLHGGYSAKFEKRLKDKKDYVLKITVAAGTFTLKL